MTRTTVSSAEGSYSFPELNLGSYDVTASAPGFSTQIQHGVQITIGNVSALNLTLKTGSSETTINVDASAPTVETQSSDIGGTIQNRQVEELPLALGGVGALRSPESFEFSAAGDNGPRIGEQLQRHLYVEDLVAQSFRPTMTCSTARTRREVKTAPSSTKRRHPWRRFRNSRLPRAFPQRSTGATEGGIESFVTKSGTNRYHGTVFDIIKNAALDANTWFNNGDLATNCVGANNTPQCTGLYGSPPIRRTIMESRWVDQRAFRTCSTE